MQKIKNIIFDYGNVIFMIDFIKTQKAFEKLGIVNPEKLFAHAGHASFFDEFEKGNITAAEFRNHIRAAAQQPHLTDIEIDNAWNSLLIGVPDGYHHILSQAKERYRTFLLSNNNEIHYNAIITYLQNTCNIDNNHLFFEKDYYSHLLKMRKPNKDIFEFVLDNHQLQPSETLFIDDSPQHILTAKEMGFKTHLMEPNDNLKLFFERENYLN